jgi:hypothetical protein
VMDLYHCMGFLQSVTPPIRLQDVAVYTTTGNIRKRVSKTLQTAQDAEVPR